MNGQRIYDFVCGTIVVLGIIAVVCLIVLQ